MMGLEEGTYMTPLHPVTITLTEDQYRRLVATAGERGKTKESLLSELVAKAIEEAARESKIGMEIKSFTEKTIPGPKPPR
jgi:hypothetical protein